MIQTGTLAAVAVAFARFSGVLWPSISEDKYLVGPIHLSAHYAVSLSSTQLLAIGIITLLTLTNTLGLSYGKYIQNLFTIAKTGALIALTLLGIFLGRNAAAISANFTHPWHSLGLGSSTEAVGATTVLGLFCCRLLEPDRVTVFR